MTTREEALRLADALVKGTAQFDSIWTLAKRAAALLRQWPDAATQEPVARVRVHATGGNAGIAWSAIPTADAPLMRDGDLLYAAPPPGWMPIESAPKSKDDILLISRNGNTRIDTGGFAHHMMNAAKVDGDECIFTHWMPLPPPPGAAQPAQPAGMVPDTAWLIEWQAHGYGPQWWGFNHTPSKHADWCSDANNAIRFSRKEDAERMRLHVIAVAGFSGRPDYAQQVTVTEHMWPTASPAQPAGMVLVPAWVLRRVANVLDDLANADDNDVSQRVWIVTGAESARTSLHDAIAAAPAQPAAPAVEPLTERIAVLEMALRKVSMNAVFTGNGECSLSFAIVKEVDAALAAIERAHGIAQGEQQ